MENKKIRLAAEGLQYKRGFKWQTVAYADIAQAYMRVEEVNARVLRGTANFNTHFLMLKLADGNLLKLGIFPRPVIQDILEQLKKEAKRLRLATIRNRRKNNDTLCKSG